MTHYPQTTPASQRAMHQAPVSPGKGAAPETPSLLKQVHRLLSGRYWLAIPLALIGVVAGGIGGWSIAPEPVYRSDGVVRIAPTVPRVLYDNEMNQVPPMFGDFVEAQSRMIQSQRVIEQALLDEDLQQAAGGRTLTTGMIRSGLSTRHGGQLIEVRYVDESREFAAAVVTAVLRAYNTHYGEQDAVAESQRMQILDQRRTSRRAELTSLRNRISDIAGEQGVEALQDRHDYAVSELRRVEMQLNEVQMVLAQLEAAEGEDDVAEGEEDERDDALNPNFDELAEAAIDPANLRIQDLARVDPELERLHRERKDLEAAIVQNASEYGPAHRTMRRLRNNLQSVEQQIDAYVEANRDMLLEALAMASGSGEVYGASAEELREREERLQAMYDTLEAETRDLGSRVVQIQRVEEEVAIAQQQLSDVQRRMDSLNVESLIGGRIEVLSEGTTPGAPYRDQRRALAGVGGLAGMSVGVGLVLLLGLMDKRFRTAEDTQSGLHNAPLLGILPQLPDLVQLEEAGTAAHAVHHIRTLLQIGIDRNGSKTLGVLSPTAGEGKTSLCHALGLSFAESSSKTLMIDCDVVGGMLSETATATARRRIGHILQRDGVISEEQLDDALKDAQASGRRVGEILVERGYLNDETLTRALDSQAKDAIGLLDVVEGEPLENCVVPAGVDHLYLLPLGSVEARHAAKLSPAGLQKVLAQAREAFDVVLIDTGPLLASIEASMVATQSDATVMVVSRGSRRPDVERAVNQLHSMNAILAGVVFNRASGGDVYRYGFSNSHRSEAAMDAGFGNHKGPYGPMARAVGATAGNGKSERDKAAQGALPHRSESENGNKKH